MKELSAGVIIKNSKDQILGCAPYGKSGVFDIPKGHVEENENFANAAVREVLEETGIELNSVSDIKPLGKFHYNKYKDLVLFYHEGDYDTNKMKCTSYFELYGKNVPEMIGYKWIDIEDIQKYFYKSLSPVLIKIINYKQ